MKPMLLAVETHCIPSTQIDLGLYLWGITVKKSRTLNFKLDLSPNYSLDTIEIYILWGRILSGFNSFYFKSFVGFFMELFMFL